MCAFITSKLGQLSTVLVPLLLVILTCALSAYYPRSMDEWDKKWHMRNWGPKKNVNVGPRPEANRLQTAIMWLGHKLSPPFLGPVVFFGGFFIMFAWLRNCRY